MFPVDTAGSFWGLAVGGRGEVGGLCWGRVSGVMSDRGEVGGCLVGGLCGIVGEGKRKMG